MRVISGSAKGTALFSLNGTSTRPTSDFVKENLFNIIQNDVYDASFLDLFAGTGAIGIEALSRGAASAVFVDVSQKCISLIERNLEKTRLKEKAILIKADITAAIRKLNGTKFDIIFLDPPYSKNYEETVLRTIVECDLLAEDSYIVFETAKTENAPSIEGLEIFREKIYSGTKLVFIKPVY